MTVGNEAYLAQPNQQAKQEFCAEVTALIPAFALGATDPEEARFVQTGLARCPEAVVALADYTELTEQIVHSAPPAVAPAHLAQDLQTALALSRKPPSVAQQSRERRSNHWNWGRLFGLPGLGFSAALLALLLLVASNFYWNSRQNELLAQHSILQRQLQEQNTLVARLRAGHFQRLELATAPGGGPTSHAMVMYDPTATQALLYAENFPQLVSGQVYQLWLIRGETRTSGGLFQVDADGFGVLVIDAPQPLRDYERLGITPEPAGGSPGPTAPPVVTGAF